MQGVIEAGGVQWMTAGRGIIHSEMPKVTTGDLWGFQLWINLPKKDKMVKPRSVLHILPSPALFAIARLDSTDALYSSMFKMCYSMLR